jgi:S-adenosylmethionine decarboxylase proenzyme
LIDLNSAPSHLGQHVLAEFYDCHANVLNNPVMIETLMKEAAEACGATIVQSCFHRFNPYGVSGVVVISESHLAIHTWPEYGYASVDLYTCGDACDPNVAFEYIRQKLASAHATATELKRGRMDWQNKRLEHVAPQLIGTREICTASAAEAFVPPVTTAAAFGSAGGQ